MRRLLVAGLAAALLNGAIANGQTATGGALSTRPVDLEKRVSGDIADARVIGDHGYAITYSCLYEFDTDKPDTWRSLCSLRGTSICRIVGFNEKGDLLMLGGKTVDGLQKPAVYSWQKGHTTVDYVNVLASDKCAISDAGTGVVGEGSNLAFSTNAGAQWIGWSPAHFAIEHPVESVAWVDQARFAVTNDGTLSMVEVDRGGPRTVWSAKSDDLPGRLAASPDAIWTIGADEKTQWLNQRRLKDGEILHHVELPMVPHVFLATKSYVVGARDESNPKLPRECWFVIRHDAVDATVKKHNGQYAVVSAVETSKKVLWLIRQNGVIARGDQEDPESEAQFISADNSTYQKIETDRISTELGSPEQLLEAQHLLPRLSPAAQIKLMEECRKQPGTPREQMQWLIEQLRKLPPVAGEVPETGRGK